MNNLNDIVRSVANATQEVMRSPRFLKNVEEIVRTSIDLNFSEGGRFGNGILGGGSQKWEPSYRSREQNGQPLNDTGILRQSTLESVKVGTSANVITISMGSKLPQAAIHNFGGKIPITNKSRGFFSFQAKNAKKNRKTWLALFLYSQKNDFFNVKARPYLVLQNEDVEEITNLFFNFFLDTIKK